MPTLSRADLHVHTSFSDGAASPEDILNYYAVYPDLHLVAITDHDTLDGALRVRDFHAAHRDVFGSLEVIVGEEISAHEGHVLGLFLEHWLPPGLPAAETIARIHEQGGLAIAAHPYTHWLPFTGLKGVKDLALRLPFDAVETRNGNITECYANYWAQWRAWTRGLCQVGASDGHFREAIGCCYTLFEGRTAGDLREAIARKATRAAGRVYGPLTVGRYLWQRWRSGQSIVPSRREYDYEAGHGALRVHVSDRSGLHVLVLHLQGDLDARTMPELKEKITAIPASGFDLVLGLGDLTRLDSAGITGLISGLRAAERHGRRFVLASPSARAQEALSVAALDRAFVVHPSEEAALRALGHANRE